VVRIKKTKEEMNNREPTTTWQLKKTSTKIKIRISHPLVVEQPLFSDIRKHLTATTDGEQQQKDTTYIRKFLEELSTYKVYLHEDLEFGEISG